MNSIQFQTLEDVYDMQIEHLRAQQNHLKFMHQYHAWMKRELAQPGLIDLHATILENITEALKHLDQLVETLQPASYSSQAGISMPGSRGDQL